MTLQSWGWDIESERFQSSLGDRSLVRDTPSRHPGRIALGASWSMRIRQWKILLIRSDSLHLMVRQRTGVMRVIMPAVRSTGQPRRGVYRRRR
jgi:hypothetical protein